MNCPAPTQNPTLNAENRLRAVKRANYGPVRLTLLTGRLHDLKGGAETRYWSRMAGKWGIPFNQARARRCGNCAAYDTSLDMVACGGANRSGSVGYCRAWNFTCAARRTCLSWSPRR